MAIMVFCGLPLLTAARGHLTVDLFDKWLLRPGMGWWHRLVSALVAAVLLLIGVQLVMMDHFLDRARERALWYSGFGVPVFVGGMMVSAFALRDLAGGVR